MANSWLLISCLDIWHALGTRNKINHWVFSVLWQRQLRIIGTFSMCTWMLMDVHKYGQRLSLSMGKQGVNSAMTNAKGLPTHSEAKEIRLFPTLPQFSAISNQLLFYHEREGRRALLWREKCFKHISFQLAGCLLFFLEERGFSSHSIICVADWTNTDKSFSSLCASPSTFTRNASSIFSPLNINKRNSPAHIIDHRPGKEFVLGAGNGNYAQIPCCLPPKISLKQLMTSGEQGGDFCRSELPDELFFPNPVNTDAVLRSSVMRAAYCASKHHQKYVYQRQAH